MKVARLFFFIMLFVIIMQSSLASTYNESECVQDRFSADGVCVKTPLESPTYQLADSIGYMMESTIGFFYNLTPGYVAYLVIMALTYIVIYLMWWIRVSFNDMP